LLHSTQFMGKLLHLSQIHLQVLVEAYCHYTFSPLVSLEKMTNQFNKLEDHLQEPLQMCSLQRLWVSTTHTTFDFVLCFGGVPPGFPLSWQFWSGLVAVLAILQWWLVSCCSWLFLFLVFLFWICKKQLHFRLNKKTCHSDCDFAAAIPIFVGPILVSSNSHFAQSIRKNFSPAGLVQ